MMEIRTIDGKLFIATKTGKRETFLPPERVIAAAQQEAAQASAIIADLRDREAATQSLLESALLALEPTTRHRVDLGVIEDEIKAHERDAAQAHALIVEVDELLLHHTAEQIRREDAERIADVLKPFTEFLNHSLKEQTHVC